jgi:hypothetical protein
MNFLKKPIILIASALLVLPASAFSQYIFEVEPFFNYFKDPKRYELAGTMIMPQGTFIGGVRVKNGGSFVGDSNIKRSATGTGIGGSIGLSIPIKAVGHISCFAVGWQLMGNMYTWTDLNKTMEIKDGTFSPNTPTLGASTLQIAMPIGLDYKAGNDAILTKRLIFGTSLGAGFIPQMNMTKLVGPSGFDTKTSFGCTPYVKAEGGVFIGMCVKVRVMYTMGDITLIDVNRMIPTYNDGPFKLNSNSNLMLSLILMPFSVGWKETDWWNTHDTYNQHDRLN